LHSAYRQSLIVDRSMAWLSPSIRSGSEPESIHEAGKETAGLWTEGVAETYGEVHVPVGDTVEAWSVPAQPIPD